MCRLAALTVVAAVLAGCGSATIGQLPLAAEPPSSPRATAPAAGRVVPVGNKPEGVTADAKTGLVAVGLRDPAQLALVDGATGRVARRVALPGAPRHLQLAGPGGPVLVPAEPANELVEVTLPGGRSRPLPTGRFPHDATEAGGHVFAGDERANTVTVDDGRRFGVATQPGGLAPLRGGRELAVVSVRERVLETYDTRTLKRTQRAPAGVGPTHVVTDGRDRLYVADTQGDALLVFSRRPTLTLERRVFLPGGPYGIAIDPTHHRLWVTLPARNELVELPAHGRPHVIARYPTVRQPNTVAVDERTGRVFVTGKVAGVLQLVDPG